MVWRGRSAQPGEKRAGAVMKCIGLAGGCHGRDERAAHLRLVQAPIGLDAVRSGCSVQVPGELLLDLGTHHTMPACSADSTS